jgi:hypothetical protein
MAPLYPCCFSWTEPLAPLPFPSQAVELLRHALKEYEGSLGNDHPQTLNCAGQPRGPGRQSMGESWGNSRSHGENLLNT